MSSTSCSLQLKWQEMQMVQDTSTEKLTYWNWWIIHSQRHIQKCIHISFQLCLRLHRTQMYVVCRIQSEWNPGVIESLLFRIFLSIVTAVYKVIIIIEWNQSHMTKFWLVQNIEKNHSSSSSSSREEAADIKWPQPVGVVQNTIQTAKGSVVTDHPCFAAAPSAHCWQTCRSTVYTENETERLQQTNCCNCCVSHLEQHIAPTLKYQVA